MFCPSVLNFFTAAKKKSQLISCQYPPLSCVEICSLHTFQLTARLSCTSESLSLSLSLSHTLTLTLTLSLSLCLCLSLSLSVCLSLCNFFFSRRFANLASSGENLSLSSKSSFDAVDT